MALNRTFGITACCLFAALFITPDAYAQDKLYTTDGRVLTGKVIEVNPKEIRYYFVHGHDSVLYVIYQRVVDSIVYSNGATDVMQGHIDKKRINENIPELNTWSFDLLGFTFLSVSQSYERRLKAGWLGLRVPLYIGFRGGGVAGVGTFIPGSGVYYPGNGGTYNYPNQNVYSYASGGFSIATGINPRFYLFKHRTVRAFIGPETTIGYSTVTYQYESYNGYNTVNYYNSVRERDGTFAALAKFGLMFHPLDRFNMCLDGGVGTVCMFGSPNPLGWAGAWHIGFTMGTNF